VSLKTKSNRKTSDKRNRKRREVSKRLGASGGRSTPPLQISLYPPPAPSRPRLHYFFLLFSFLLRRSRKIPPLFFIAANGGNDRKNKPRKTAGLFDY